MALSAGTGPSAARERPLADQIGLFWSRWGVASLEFDLSAGAAIIDGLYHGDPKLWRKRQKSDPSFRRLSALVGNRISAKRLYHAVCTYLIAQHAGGVSRWKQLTVSHFHAVAGLPAETACELLDRAERELLSVESLRLTARQHRTRGCGGRRPKPTELKHLEQLTRSPLPPPTEVDVPMVLDALSPEKRRELGVALLERGSDLLRIGSKVVRQASARQLNVLVVDDEASARATARYWLEDAGHLVTIVASAAEAFAMSAAFDVAVVDVRLGTREDGIEVGRRLLDERRAFNVLLVTGFRETWDVARAQNVGPLLDRADLPGALFEALARIAFDAASR
jgi:CheY-like chemotaxis protein